MDDERANDGDQGSPERNKEEREKKSVPTENGKETDDGVVAAVVLSDTIAVVLCVKNERNNNIDARSTGGKGGRIERR